MSESGKAPRWVVVLAGAALGVVLAGGVTLVQHPKYESTAKTFVSAVDGSTAGNDLANAQTFVSDRLKSYTEVVTSTSVLDPVISRLNLDETPIELAKEISVDVALNSVIIDITVEDRSATTAAAIANALVAQLPIAVGTAENPKGDKTVPVVFSTIQKADVAESPSSPHFALNLAAGFVLGVLLGLGVVYLRDGSRRRDTRAARARWRRSVTSSSLRSR